MATDMNWTVPSNEIQALTEGTASDRKDAEHGYTLISIDNEEWVIKASDEFAISAFGRAYHEGSGCIRGRPICRITPLHFHDGTHVGMERREEKKRL